MLAYVIGCAYVLESCNAITIHQIKTNDECNYITTEHYQEYSTLLQMASVPLCRRCCTNHDAKASWRHPGKSAKSCGGAPRRDVSASPDPGLHFQWDARSSDKVPSSSSTTCFPMFGRSLNEWLGCVLAVCLYRPLNT